MDIKDILSPNERESARNTPSAPHSPVQSPFKHVQRTQSGPAISGLVKHGQAPSPLTHPILTQHKATNHTLSPAHTVVPSPLISPVPNSSQSPFFQRASSTQSMDTLADLAAMQNHQPPRSAPPFTRGSVSYDGQVSPSIASAITSGLTSNPRASIDINMMDAPKPTSRTDFTGSSLSTEKQERLTELADHLANTPSAYESHVERINTLHEGLVNHIYPSSDRRSRRDPRTYDLLQDLRHARDQMEKMFAVGENLWCDWIQDESLLAQTAEDRIAVVEKCRIAVEEEQGSVKLWSAYGDWVYHCYLWSHDDSTAGAHPDEERLVGRELFTLQLVHDVWQEATLETGSNIAHSQQIWKKYLDLRIPNLDGALSSDQASLAMAMFQDRLQTPHLQWEQTFELFSTFVSANYASQYEEIMMETNRSASTIKAAIAARESFESTISKAQDSGDRDAEYMAFRHYIDWEKTSERRKKPDSALIDALYQRVELSFPSDTFLWEEHVAFLMGKSMPATLSLLERATKHCPWSGLLWSHHLLCSERLNLSFQDTEEVKHKATSTGLLETAGIEDVIAVHAAWCSYLRRRSVRPDGNEEDIDVAEMGIRSSIETVASVGAKLGLGEAPGSSFRLRRIYITFLTDGGRWDNARHEFDTSIDDFGRSYEFWLQFYQWEMMRWRRFAFTRRSSRVDDVNTEPPELATAVLKKALDQPNLDYPEPIIQAFLAHCEDHADAEELQQALLRARQLEQIVAARRQIEVAQAAEAEAAAVVEAEAPENEVHGAKRKREAEDENGHETKKPRAEDDPQNSVEAPQVDVLKRDRENATIIVENLPEDITEVKVRRYFNNCGVVRSLKFLPEQNSAVIEFEDDDAAKYALSRDGQELEDSILSVKLDSGSTLYLANYLPSADEIYIRSLLDAYGEIISIRFPSLQANKKRRFCYVQFRKPEEAHNATELDDKEVDGHKIVCKISNPAVRKPRSDRTAVNDGRTIFVGQLNFKTTEDELRVAFSTYGKIDLVRMPRDQNIKNRNKGIAFVTYSSTEEAEAALEMHTRELKGRKIVVKIATNNNRQNSVAKRTASPALNGRGVSSAPSTNADGDDLRQRQIFLTNVPDTVNESRLQVMGEKAGKVLRVVLKTNHQGAIIEYSTATEAGEAALKLDGYEIDPERYLNVVSEQEMKSKSPEKKNDNSGSHKPKIEPPKAAPIGLVAPVRRPGQPGRKGGHLGRRSAIPSRDPAQIADGETNGDTKKSNNDFRKMIYKE